MSIDKYAPVIITTLNRYNHFRQCLESLEQCKGADKTDVYVALDYPPTEKYITGWEKNVAYIQTKKTHNKFKSLTVFKRETNYYFSGKGNGSTAIRDATANTDRYIFSEDDNIFSYRFLEYINLGLELYKDNEEILAICGYTHPYGYSPSNYNGNSVLLQEMSAWGYGSWVGRIAPNNVYTKEISNYISDKQLKNHFLKRRPDIFTGLLTMKSQNVFWKDCFLTAYLYKTNKYCVFPLVSLVKNIGWDGSGTHGGKIDGFLNQQAEAYIQKEYIITIVNQQEKKEIDNYIIEYWKHRTSLIHRIVNFCMITIYSLTGKIITFKPIVKKVKQIRNWWYTHK